LRLFLQSLEQELEVLREALDRQDLPQADGIAHKLITTAGKVGAIKLAANAQTLADAWHQGGDLENTRAALVESAKLTHAAVSTWLAAHGDPQRTPKSA
jgi:HPt (histidine-containing phosphotransfer) domain-containing protein